MTGGSSDATEGRDGAGSRRDFLEQAVELLWPERAAGGRTTEYLVLPNAERARLVLPLRARRAAARMVRRSASSRTARGRLVAHAMSVALTAGVAGLVLRDRVRVQLPDRDADTVETLLADLLGEPVVTGLHVSRPRANRKPVLQALAPSGELRAYVKVGVNPLTRRLVAHEASVLREVAPARGRPWTAPRVLHQARWHDLEVLVLSPLPTWRRTVALDPGRRATVAYGIAAGAGLGLAEPAGSPYVARLRARVAGLRPAHEHALAGLLDRTLDAHGARPLPFGAWHGDFTEWNLAALPDTVLVWDWERYRTGVPVGYDLVHHDLWQRLLRPGEDVGALLRAVPESAPPRLARIGLDAREAATVARLYLVEIVARYLHDGQHETGQLARLLPAMLDTLAAMPARPGA